jgi:DNA replication protein DnaC
MMRLIVPETSQVEEFITFLYDGLEGYVYSPVKNLNIKPSEEGHWTQHFFKWPEEYKKLLDHIDITARSYDVYLAPAVFKSASSLKSEIKETKVLWVELDEMPPQGSSFELTEPSYKIQTSTDTHQHWYWKLDDPISDSSSIEIYTRSLTYCIPGADSSGWDANQVLRIPGTYNYKRSTPIFVLESNLGFNSSHLFDDLPKPPKSISTIDLSKVPDVTTVVLKYPWTKQASDLYLTIEPPYEQRSTFMVRLAYFCAEMRMDDNEIFSILFNADERWGKFKDRRDRIQRLTEIISRVRIKYPSIQESAEVPSSDVSIVGTYTLLKSKREIQWLIPGLLESKGNLLLTGPNGVGKTQFSLNLAIALALGQSTLNFTIAKQSKILFLSLEMGWEQIKSFLLNITKILSVDQLNILEKQLLILPMGEAIALNNNEKHQQAIEKAIELHNPDGLMIDSLGTSVSGDLGSHATVEPYLNWNDRIRNKYNVFTWVIHHHRKQGGKEIRKPTGVDDVYGDTYITGRASTVYCLWPTRQSNIIEAIPLKLRFSEKPPNWFIKRNGDLTMGMATKIKPQTEVVKVTITPTAPTGNSKIVGI